MRVKKYFSILLLSLLFVVGCGVKQPTANNSTVNSPNVVDSPPPEIIKGALAFNLHNDLPDEAARLKKVGVNTVVVYAPLAYSDGEYLPPNGNDSVTHTVQLAKESGFAVILVPEFWGPYASEIVPVDRETHLQLARDAAVYWAQIAEQEGVEFFAPYNEFNGNILANFLEPNDEEDQISEVTTSWHNLVLEDIHNVFSGVVMAKLDPVETDMDFSGYDYIGTTIVHNNQSLEDFRTDVQGIYSDIAIVAQRSNAKWFVSEAIMEYGSEEYSTTHNQSGESLDELQDEYFLITIEEYQAMQDIAPSGYIFAGWTWPGAGVRDRIAEQVLTDFFQAL